MKKILFAALLSGASLFAADYSGIWNGKGAIQSQKYVGGIPQTAQLTLLQAGNSLSGTVRVGNAKPTKITSGSVSGSTLTLVTSGGGKTVTGTLTASGSTLSGSMTTSSGQVFNVAFVKR